MADYARPRITGEYLSIHATVAEAVAWLGKRSGRPWTTAELLDQGLTPYFWHKPLSLLHPDPKSFEDVNEGFLAPVLFASDLHCLRVYQKAEVAVSRTPKGELFRMVFPRCVHIDDLIFKRLDVMNVLPEHSQGDEQPLQMARSVSRTRTQELEILRHVAEAGFQPSALPVAAGGKPGAKAAVRAKVAIPGPLFQSKKTFDLAWERLRASKELCDKK